MDLQIPGFRLDRQIGKGGMAIVHLAIQENFDRKVAIKILTPTLETEREFAERFLIEAKTVATLNHPHIIPVFDVGKIDSHYYIAMEYLPGNSLSHWIELGLEEAEVLQIIREIAEALHYAHGKGIVHRDIKPDNIMFREDNSAVLTDFGIASSDRSKNLTQEGTMIGTPAYMSPEQARGFKLDRRSDVYSLGVVFYEMLCKRQPYIAEDPIGVALAQVSEPVPILPDRFKHYQSFLDKIMAKNIDDRFSSCLAVAKAIKAIEQGETDRPRENKPEQVGESLNVAASSAPHESLSLKDNFTEAEKDIEAATTAKASSSVAGMGASVLPEKKLTVTITETRKALIFKESQIHIQLISDDGGQFIVQFGQVSQKLLNWHSEFGKKAKKVELSFYCQSWLVDKIESSIRKMLGTKDPYGFLSDIELVVNIYNLSGQPIAQHLEF